MQVKGKTQIKLENFEKCYLLCDNDASIPSLYDYSCALKSFLFGQMKAAEESEKKQETSQPE